MQSEIDALREENHELKRLRDVLMQANAEMASKLDDATEEAAWLRKQAQFQTRSETDDT